jgi:hypothetical protein
MLHELAVALQDFKLDINNTVLEELKTKGFYTVWQEQWGRMTTEAGGDIAMLRLLKIAEQEYAPDCTALDDMAAQIACEARYDLEALEAERRASKEAGRKMSYTEVDRPADMYRRWMKPLRFIHQYHYGVGTIIRDLELEQTMPYGELDSPHWVDGYTGEVDPDAMLEKVNFPTSESDEESVFYSEAFDEEDEFTIEHYEEREYEKPVWMQVQEDMQVTSSYFDLANEFKIERQLLRERINQALTERREVAVKHIAMEAHRKQLGPPLVLLGAAREIIENRVLSTLAQQVYAKCNKVVWEERKAIFSEAREAVRRSPEAKAYLHCLQQMAERDESPVDLAVLFLSMQHGLCFEEYDSRDVRLLKGGTLYEFIEDNEEELLENMNNPAGVSEIAPSREYIDQYCEETLQLYAETGEADLAKSRFNHPFFIEGYIRAATVLRNVTKEKLVSAGHENFRQRISPEGNRAFHQARLEGKDMKAAMRTFWQVANRPVPKPLPRITAVRDTGLVLDTGRAISFGIAVLKVQHNEIELSQEDKVRLKDVLIQRNWGRVLQEAL